ncbi:hypothetical protein [Aureimonas psammosilenae]|uniref:hypothetical protein n=1 Tax=Aureimonas psammosilenae TaxID=2495496 RepID=UPI00186A6C49|nr:hypothetical protein [Aureimonas psammosilenae]
MVAAKDDLLVPNTRSLALTERLREAKLALADHSVHAVNVTQAPWLDETILRFRQAV